MTSGQSRIFLFKLPRDGSGAADEVLHKSRSDLSFDQTFFCLAYEMTFFFQICLCIHMFLHVIYVRTVGGEEESD